MDAYVSQDFDVADAPSQVRFGRQVINWGEGLFIRGMNLHNAIDVAAARRAGSEISAARRNGKDRRGHSFANLARIPNPSFPLWIFAVFRISSGHGEAGYRSCSPVGSFCYGSYILLFCTVFDDHFVTSL